MNTSSGEIADHPPKPMINNGSICWFNSFMQGILSCRSFTVALRKYVKQNETTASPMMFALISIMYTYKVLPPDKLFSVPPDAQAALDKVFRAYPSVILPRQYNDPADFVNIMLNELSREPGAESVVDLFKFSTTTYERCPKCGFTLITSARDMFTLKTNKQGFLTSARGIDASGVIATSSSASLCYPDNGYRCPLCRATSAITAEVVIENPPHVFIAEVVTGDPRSAVMMQRSLCEQIFAAPSYQLRAKIIYGGGHYIAVTRRGDKYYNCNDSSVTNITSAIALAPSGNILIYERT